MRVWCVCVCVIVILQVCKMYKLLLCNLLILFARCSVERSVASWNEKIVCMRTYVLLVLVWDRV